MAAFVTVLVCSNLIGPAKIAQITLPWLGAVSFGAGVLFFPVVGALKRAERNDYYDRALIAARAPLPRRCLAWQDRNLLKIVAAAENAPRGLAMPDNGRPSRGSRPVAAGPRRA